MQFNQHQVKIQKLPRSKTECAKVQNGMYLDNAGGAMGFIGKYALDELNISINFDQFYIQND